MPSEKHKEPSCYHCGDPCGAVPVRHDGKHFCCTGCKTVYEILSENGLTYYYDLETAAGNSPRSVSGKYDFLDNTEIAGKLVEFNNDDLQIITLHIPQMHCSSCIWVLENLNRLNEQILTSQVDFPQKTVRITFKAHGISLKSVVLLLAYIGYEPSISLKDLDGKKKKVDRGLIYKLGVAGFAFGNVMFLSFPEYLDLAVNEGNGGEFWLNQYQTLFRWLMFAFSVPVVFYAARDYFTSAYKGLRSGFLNIDVPIALGISVLFLRSTYDIVTDSGPGFFDSLTGLVFFLLLGRFFQQKTYSFLSFERDYKSYFPIAITRIRNGREETIQVYDIGQGDRLLIRNEELIPVDGTLINGKGKIDYSFVTGESQPIVKKSGDTLFAGGRQVNGAIEMEALKSVSQSYLTKLWGNAVFQENKNSRFRSLTDRIGKRFTLAVLTIAAVAGAYWWRSDPGLALNVITAVLIIACPCAIALAAPFTLGNLLRIFGRRKFYLKDAATIERLAQVDTAIFDKTGTLTMAPGAYATYEGMPLTPDEESLLKNTLRASNHPLSRALYEMLSEQDIVTLDEYEEHLGKGLEGAKDQDHIKIGSAEFVGTGQAQDAQETSVHISSNLSYKGRYVFHNRYREGLSGMLADLARTMSLAILSGDNAGERKRLQKILPEKTPMYFNQKPEDKLRYISFLQEHHKNVLMVGDGLNDAGALAQSNVGIAISENINVFSPACDGILDASKFQELYTYVKASRAAIGIIKTSFVLSLCYNLVGLYFAVTGQLQPVIAAILMPLSSITIVGFTTLATNVLGRRLR